MKISEYIGKNPLVILLRVITIMVLIAASLSIIMIIMDASISSQALELMKTSVLRVTRFI